MSEPRSAPAADQPCQLYGPHWPVPIRTQYHHSKPVYLQNRLYGRIVHPADFWVCGTCHDSLHEVIDWLLGEGRQPNPLPGPRTNTMLKARATVDWYREELRKQVVTRRPGTGRCGSATAGTAGGCSSTSAVLAG